MKRIGLAVCIESQIQLALVRSKYLFAIGLVCLSGQAAWAVETFNLGNTTTLLTGLVTLAQVNGDFKSQGLAVTEVPLPTGDAGLKHLEDGALDAYLASDITVLKHLKSSPTLRILATVGESDNETHIVARRDRGIASVQNLRGKRIGVQPGTAFHYFLDRLLARNGMAESDVRLAPGKLEAFPGMLARGEIDAYVTREPFLSESRERLGGNALVLSAPGLMVKRFVLVSNVTTLKRRGAAMQSLLKGLYLAERRARIDPASAVASLSGPLDVPAKDLRAQLAEARLSLTMDDHLLFSLEKAERWQRRLRGEPELPIPNFLMILDEHLLREAKPAGVTLNR